MALTAGELGEIVWAETRALGVGRLDGTGEVNAVRAMVARLAAARQGVGFPRRTPLPRTDDPRFGETARALMAIADAAKDARDPQNRLLIWIAGSDSARIERGTNPPPPAPWTTLPAGAIVNQFRGQLPASGKLVDVFSRAPLAGDADGQAFVNALTGTGLPGETPLAAAAPPPRKKPVSKTLVWTLGIAGVVLYVIGGGAAALTGTSLGAARSSLGATSPAYQELILGEVAKACDAIPAAFRADHTPQLCMDLGAKAKPSDLLKRIAACATKSNSWTDVQKLDCPVAWTAALAADQEQPSSAKSYVFKIMTSASSYLSGLQAATGAATIVPAFLCGIVGVVALLIALGLGAKGRLAGIWIDTRNRVSLARAQVTLWTLVVLSGYFTISMFNVGFAVSLGWPPDLSSYVAFPSMPPSIWTALGISVASPLISKLLLTSKDTDVALDVAGEPRALDKRGLLFQGTESSGLDKNEFASEASLADLFMGEENANSDTVDVARLQNVLITIMLVSSYFLFLAELMSGIRMESILDAGKVALFDALPNLGATFTSLLGVSHATYLVTKAHNSKDLGTTPT